MGDARTASWSLRLTRASYSDDAKNVFVCGEAPESLAVNAATPIFSVVLRRSRPSFLSTCIYNRSCVSMATLAVQFCDCAHSDLLIVLLHESGDTTASKPEDAEPPCTHARTHTRTHSLGGVFLLMERYFEF